MLEAYINYPNSRITAHKPNCGHPGKHSKHQQRQISINASSISQELNKFQNNEHAWQSQSSANDSYLEIDFQDEDFEWAVVQFIQRLLGQYSKPFSGRKPHKCKGCW